MAKEPCCGFRNEFARQNDTLTPKSTDGLYNLQQISSVTASGRLTAVVEVLEEEIYRVLAIWDTLCLAVSLEDLGEEIAIRRPDFNLVTNPAQESFVDKLSRIEIGREDNQLFERNGKFLARRQCQVVDAFLKWQDPAIE